MDQTNRDLLAEFTNESEIPQQVKFIPAWIRVFCFIFITIGIFAFIVFILGMFGFSFDTSIYGLESNEPSSFLGIIIFLIFELKAIVSFGLLKRKEWAVSLGIIDALIGICICLYVMFYPLAISRGSYFTGLRLEVFFLVPYLIRLLKTRNLIATGKYN